MKNKIIEVQEINKKTDYSYSAKNESFLDGLFVPFIVRPLLKVIPYQITACFITIFSNALVFLSLIIALQAAHGSYFLWFLIPILVFVYVIGDCLDGEQARRTKTSSPLGEFLDHFLDTFVTGSLLISLITAYNVKNPILAAFAIYISHLTQASTFWEKYKKHKMHFGKFSSTETILSLTLITSLAGFGKIRDLASIKLNSFGFIQNSIGSSCPAIAGLSIIEVMMIVMLFFAFINTLATLIRSGSVSLRHWAYIILTGAATMFAALTDFQPHPIPLMTLSLLNISYVSALLVAIVMKKKDPLPDFILPVAMAVCYFLNFNRSYITVIFFAYILARVLVTATVFFYQNRRYWLWKNPLPQKDVEKTE
ncbi:MAG: CDP-alcohol phosphatidyltransferase family protein [Treponema sp.]|nr:CDP-alcohol phosphatidyltransferase family protein [Treponema sp.]